MEFQEKKEGVCCRKHLTTKPHPTHLSNCVTHAKYTYYATSWNYFGYLIILWLFLLGISCTVFVLTSTVVVLTSFVMCGWVYVWVCVCVGFVLCGCVCVYVWVLYCVGECMCGFCNVWVCVCVGFVMCGCSDNCVGVLVICVLIFTVLLYCFVYVCLFLFVTGVRTTATEWKVNCGK